MSESQDKTTETKAEMIERKLRLVLGDKKPHLWVVPSDKDVEQFEILEGT